MLEICVSGAIQFSWQQEISDFQWSLDRDMTVQAAVQVIRQKQGCLDNEFFMQTLSDDDNIDNDGI